MTYITVEKQRIDVEREPLVVAFLDNPQLCLDHFDLRTVVLGDIPKIKEEQKEALFKKCPSLFIDDKFNQIRVAHGYGLEEHLVEALSPMGPFESIVNAENDTLCSLATFQVRDKPFYVEPNAMKALRKQRLLENILMESQRRSSLGRSKGDVNETGVNELINGLLEC